MRKQVQFALAVLLVVIAVVIGWQVRREREPVYQGKPLSVWLASLDNPSGSARFGAPGWSTRWSEGNGNAVKDALGHMGPDVIPALRRMVNSRDHPFKLKLIAMARSKRLISFNIDDEWVLHYRAAAACRLAEPVIRSRLLGDWINLLVETLARDAGNEDVRFCFRMAAIGNLGPEACAPLIEALTNANTQLRRYAATALFQFRSSQPEKVAPALMDRLRNDPDSGVQFNAMQALKSMPATIVPSLLQELRQNSVSAKRWSLIVLGSFTNEAPAIVPDIVSALGDNDVGVRQEATNALKKIDPKAAARAGVK